MRLDIHKKVVYKGMQTTQGRIIFNNLLPKGYIEKFGFVNKPVTKKVLNEILENVYLYFNNHLKDTIARIQETALLYGTIFNRSLPLDDLQLPDDLKKKLKQIEKSEDMVKVTELIKEIAKEYKEYLKKIDSPLYDLFESKASKGKVEPMVVSKGIVRNIDGETQLIKSSLSDGFTPVEYFNSGNSARGGLADRVLNTSHTGYLERKLIYAASGALLSNDKDCRTQRTFDIVYSNKLKNLLIGRYFVDVNGKLNLITPSTIKLFSTGDVIKLRSPIYCKSKDICKTCYGKLSEKVNTKEIGVMAGQVLGERGTQVIMKSFHTGGTVEWKKINIFTLIHRFNSSYTLNQLKTLIDQKDYEIYTKTDIKVIFDKKIVQNVIDYQNKTITLDTANFRTLDKYNNILVWSFDESVIFAFDELKQEDIYYTFVVKSGGLIFKILPSANAVNYNYMRKIFEQSIPSDNEYQLYYRVLDVYSELGTVDSVHFETIISEICRDPDNPSNPYRYRNEFDKPPLIVSIKEIPYLNNAKLGLFFENPQKALEYGLVQEEERATSITNLVEKF